MTQELPGSTTYFFVVFLELCGGQLLLHGKACSQSSQLANSPPGEQKQQAVTGL